VVNWKIIFDIVLCLSGSFLPAFTLFHELQCARS
jgi:hypothetical protein